jgi:hypothetical protein
VFDAALPAVLWCIEASEHVRGDRCREPRVCLMPFCIQTPVESRVSKKHTDFQYVVGGMLSFFFRKPLKLLLSLLLLFCKKCSIRQFIHRSIVFELDAQGSACSYQ